MPRVNAPTSLTIQKWIADILELEYDGVGNAVYCKACDARFSCTQRAHITRHTATEKHKTSIGLQTQTQFNRDLMNFMVSCNIPWNQLNNPSFRQFITNCTSGKFSNVLVPSESSLRHTYLPAERDDIKNSLSKKFEDRHIWISVDEATDASGRSLACVAVGALDETPTQAHIIACKELERTNAKTVTGLIHSCLRELWGRKYENNVDKLLLFITDEAPYMQRAGRILQEHYRKILHLTCLAHALHAVAEKIRDIFPNVNDLISNMKQIFHKAPHRINTFRQILPQVPLPPEPVITRWGTWLEVVSYYYCHFSEIKQVVSQLDDTEAQSISKLKLIYNDPSILNDLAYIHANFSTIPLAIKKLETSALSVNEALNVIFDLRHYIFQVSGEAGELIKTKFETVLNKNPGFRTMCYVVDLLNGKEIDISSHEINMDILRHFRDFRYAPVTSVDVEKISTMKWMFTDKRRKLTASNLESLLIIFCNKSYTTEHEDTDCRDE